MIALPILDALVDLITTSINALKTFLLLVIQKNQFKMAKMEEDNSPKMNQIGFYVEDENQEDEDENL